MSRLARLIVGVLLTIPAVAIAQAPATRSPAPQAGQPPARDVAPRAGTGSSVIRGRVAAVDTGRGIRGATVRASAPENPRGRSAITDAEGRYELKDLPAGRYTLTASKPTFISLERGQTRPFESGKPLVLAEKETIDKVDFNLPLGGVIAGRVVDELGDPVVNFTVRTMRTRYTQGRRELMTVGTGVPTDDLGEFRIFGLSPGQYYVSATLRLALSSDTAGSGFAATYFPSVTNLADAQRVSVVLGQTVSNVDLTLTPVKTATITGMAVDVEGRPLSRGTLNLVQRAPAPTEGIGGAQVRPDGGFTLSNIPPGEYNLDLDSSGSSPGAGIASASRASVRVVVNGADISGVVLALTRLSGGTGRLVLSPGASLLSPSAVRVSTSSVDPDESRFYNGDAAVKDDLTFDFTAPPGQMTVRTVALPQGWALKEVRYGGKNVTDSGISFSAGEKVKDIEIELTNRPPAVSGTVRNAKGEAADDYAVLLFAENRERWTANPRQFAIARPDQSGSFNVSSLAPGDYCAIALEYVDQNEAGDPDILNRLGRDAVRFSIREGETRNLDLKLSAP